MTTTTTSNATNHSLVGNALQLLGVGLGPYVTGRLREAAGRGHYVPNDVDAIGDVEGDVAVMLRVMAAGWNEVFRDYLGPVERSLVSEIRETRNRWAHLESFDEDDLDRALDSVGRLLTAIGAQAEGDRVHKAKHRLRRRRYGSDKPAAPSDAAPSDTAPAETVPAEITEREPAAPTPEPEHPPAEPAPAPIEPAATPTEPAATPIEPAPAVMPPAIGVAADERIEVLIQQGVSYRQQGEFRFAIASFGKAISANREYAVAWYHRALTWGHMGEYERAVNDFNRVISLDHRFADAYNGRGYAQFCLGDDPKAIADFEAALILAPDDTLTHANLEKAKRRWAERNGGH